MECPGSLLPPLPSCGDSPSFLTIFPTGLGRAYALAFAARGASVVGESHATLLSRQICLKQFNILLMHHIFFPPWEASMREHRALNPYVFVHFPLRFFLSHRHMPFPHQSHTIFFDLSHTEHT